MVETPGSASSSEERWAWFLAQLGADGSARVVEPGVVEVVEVDEPEDDDDEVVDAVASTYRVHVDRADVVRLGWSSHDLFDDRVEGASPPADDPVRAGLDQLAFDAWEAAASRMPGEDHVVLDGSSFRPSVRAELPVVRAPVHLPRSGGVFWSARRVDPPVG